MPPVRFCYESPDPLSRFNQALIAQLGNRYTYNRSADAEALCEIMFRRQLLPRNKATFTDLPCNFGGDASRKLLITPDFTKQNDKVSLIALVIGV